MSRELWTFLLAYAVVAAGTVALGVPPGLVLIVAPVVAFCWREP